MLSIEIQNVKGDQKIKLVSLVDEASKVVDHFRVPTGLAQKERLINHDLYGIRIKAANRKAGVN